MSGNLGSSCSFAVNVTVIPDERTVQFVEDPVLLEMIETSHQEWNASGWLFDTLDNIITADA